MIIACYILVFIYAATIGWLIYGYSKTPDFRNVNTVPKTGFSIIVPFRNEAENLPKLLNSISKLDYPADLFEVILIDDASDTTFIPENFRHAITIADNIRKTDSPKKDAINTAIALAKNQWVITTDADCRVPEKWLATIDGFIQKNKPQMIAGAVRYNCGNSLLHHFQQIEFASLQVTTMATFGLGCPFMCNGANFAYARSFFYELNGFDGNENRAGGDDVFLLQKALSRFPDRVAYLKSEDTMVTTQPAGSWKDLFYQRVRWVSKSGSYSGYSGPLLGLIVFFGNVSWIILLVAMLFGELAPWHFAYAVLLKNSVDCVLAYRDGDLIQESKYFIPASFAYPFFSVGVALYSVFGKYEWKGRTFRK